MIYLKEQLIMVAAVNIAAVLLFSNSFAEPNPTISKEQEIEPGTCDSACQRGIDESLDYTTSLHQQQTANHDSMLQRVIKLETEFHNSVGRLDKLIQRVSRLETHLTGNVTKINKRITDEVRVTIENTLYEIELVKVDFNAKLANLTSVVQSIEEGQNNSNNGAIAYLYHNVTKRIDSLEFGKISNLTSDNNIWRKNFRVVNATFLRIKQSSSCFCK